jgi:hypothetical protein
VKRKTLIKNIKNANKTKKNDSFLYELYQEVVYKGGLYQNYKNKIAKVTSRSTEKGYYKWYVIEFDDGYTMRVKESWIGETENMKGDDNISENKDN